jgi:hypothetical protein
LIFNIIIVVKNNKISSLSHLIVNKIDKLDQYARLMKSREIANIINNNTKLATDLTIIDENNSPVAFAQIINDNSPKLIIRYSALACDICLEKELKIIQRYASKINENNIIILASDHNMRSLRVLKNSLSINIRVYQIEKTGITFEENNNSLFLFIVDKEPIIKDFFIPEKTLPNMSIDYYEIICDKYWNVNMDN